MSIQENVQEALGCAELILLASAAESGEDYPFETPCPMISKKEIRKLHLHLARAWGSTINRILKAAGEYNNEDANAVAQDRNFREPHRMLQRPIVSPLTHPYPGRTV